MGGRIAPEMVPDQDQRQQLQVAAQDLRVPVVAVFGKHAVQQRLDLLPAVLLMHHPRRAQARRPELQAVDLLLVADLQVLRVGLPRRVEDHIGKGGVETALAQRNLRVAMQEEDQLIIVVAVGDEIPDVALFVEAHEVHHLEACALDGARRAFIAVPIAHAAPPFPTG